MRMFCAIVEANGFSAAAERLNSTHSSLSRHLKQLEAALGVRLINRNTRSLSLTVAGHDYYRSSVDILARVDAAAQAVGASIDNPSGVLRISAPLAVGTLGLAQWLPAFQARYPSLQVELCCSDPLTDLVAQGIDVAVRICGPLADSTLIARLLHVSPMVLVASPAYLRRAGTPCVSEELSRHALLRYSSLPTWALTGPDGVACNVEVNGPLRSDTITALYAAALAGLGIAAFTQATVDEDLIAGRLLRVLPQHTLGELHYYALYPHGRYLPAKVRVFVDFMVEFYGALGGASPVKKP